LGDDLACVCGDIPRRYLIGEEEPYKRLALQNIRVANGRPLTAEEGLQKGCVSKQAGDSGCPPLPFRGREFKADGMEA